MQIIALAIVILMQAAGDGPVPSGPASPPGAAPAQRTEEPRASLSGQVLSAQTGEPLKGASVQLTTMVEQRLETQAAVSEADGSFSFQHLRPGAYGLFVQKAGYEPRGLPRPVPLAENQARSGVDIKINRYAVMTGRITDSEGLPVAGATVEAGVLRWRNGRRILIRAATGSTDDRGVYRLAGLAAGRYVLGASVPPDDSPRGEIDLGSARVFYPMAPRASEAAPLQLSYGQELSDVNLVLRPLPAFSVSGVVADAQTAGPCRACVIRADNLEESYRFSQPQSGVAADGSYRIRGLAPGSYRITAEKSAAGRRLVSSRTIQITNRDIHDVHLLAGVERGIAGRVVLESQPPAVRKDAPQSNMEVVLATPDGIGPAESSPVSPDGAFRIASLSGEPHRIRVQGLPEGAFLRSARLSGQDLGAPEFDVPDEGSPGTLELFVSFDSGKLTGRVQPPEADGAPGAVTAAVALFPADNQSPYLTSLRAGTRSDGSFTLSGIPPGSYTAFAFDRSSRLDWEDPDVQRLMQGCGKKVELDRNKQQTIELRLCSEETQP